MEAIESMVRRLSASGLLLAAIVAILGLLPPGMPLGSPSTAMAGEYVVKPACDGVDSAIGFSFTALAPFSHEKFCENDRERNVFLLKTGTTVSNKLDRAQWEFKAPSFSSIRQVRMNISSFREGNLPWGDGQSIEWNALAEASDGSLHLIEESRNPQKDRFGVTYVLGDDYEPGHIVAGTKAFISNIICNPESGTTCAAGPTLFSTASTMTVRLSDDTFPTMENFEGSIFDGIARGTEFAAVRGEDPNSSGVFYSQLWRDGLGNGTGGNLLSIKFTNVASCREPFEYVVPCPAEERFSHTIDTTVLPDGQHTLRFEVCDTTRFNCVVSGEPGFVIHNAPENIALPAISGEAKVGSQLSASAGTWGTPLNTTFTPELKWFRCPPTVTMISQCTNLNALGPAYKPVKDDVGQRLMVEVTATLNRPGEAKDTAVSAPSPIVADLPAGTGTSGTGTTTQGTAKACKVPKLKGKKLNAAKKQLQKANCKVGVIKKAKGATAKTGKVAKQKPKPGTMLPSGANVKVTLAQ